MSQKILYLIRHAKSSWKQEDLLDIDRPLNARGVQNAQLLFSDAFFKTDFPEMLLTSPATRALHTCMLMVRGLNLNHENINIEKDLYFGEVKSMISIINAALTKNNIVAVFGHNPNISKLAYHYSKGSFIQEMPTCAVVKLIQAKGENNSGKNANFTLENYITPKQINHGIEE